MERGEFFDFKRLIIMDNSESFIKEKFRSILTESDLKKTSR